MKKSIEKHLAVVSVETEVEEDGISTVVTTREPTVVVYGSGYDFSVNLEANDEFESESVVCESDDSERFTGRDLFNLLQKLGFRNANLIS